MARFKLNSPRLLNKPVTLGVALGGSSALQSVSSWGFTPGAISIALQRAPLDLGPERVELSVDLTNSGLGVAAPATSTEYDPQFHKLFYYWTGLPGGTFDKCSRLIGANDKSISFAPKVVAAFPAGTHTIDVFVYNAAGQVESAQVTFTVRAAEAVIPTSAQRHVHPAGTTTNAPAGVATVTTLAAANSAIGAADGIIWLEAGQTYTDQVTLTSSHGSRIFKAVGSGAAPRLANTQTGTFASNRGGIRAISGAWSTAATDKQLVLEGVDLEGTWDPVNLTGNGGDATPYAHLYMLDSMTCVIKDCATHTVSAVMLFEGNLGAGQWVHLEDLECDSFDTYPVYMGNREDGYLSMRNVRVAQNPVAITVSASYAQQGSPVRVNRGQIMADGFETFAQGGHAGNDYVPQPAFKVRENGSQSTTPPNGTKIFLGRGYMESQGNAVVRALSACEYNFLMDQCVAVGGYATTSIVYLGGTGATIRNNLLLCSASPFYPTGKGTVFRQFVEFQYSNSPAGNEALITQNHNEIYNNHFVMIRSQANNNNLDIIAEVRESAPTPLGYQWAVADNLSHRPNITSPVTPHAPLDSVASIAPFSTVGAVDGTGTPIPGYAIPAFAPYWPEAGSSALGGGVGTLAARFDFYGAVRPAPAAIGAFEGAP